MIGDGIFETDAGDPTERIDVGTRLPERQRESVAIEIIGRVGPGAATFEIEERPIPRKANAAGERGQSIDNVLAIDAAQPRETGVVAAQRRIAGLAFEAVDPRTELPIGAGLVAAERAMRFGDVAEIRNVLGAVAAHRRAERISPCRGAPRAAKMAADIKAAPVHRSAGKRRRIGVAACRVTPVIARLDEGAVAAGVIV